MSAGAGVAVLAAVFVVGVAGLALVMISLLPGAMLAESRVETLLRRRRAGREDAG